MNSGRHRIAFISTMGISHWGGSEELWHRSALRLLADGHTISASVQYWAKRRPQIELLRESGGHVAERKSNRFKNFALKLTRDNLETFQIKRFLRSQRPDLVVFSCGSFMDHLGWCAACASLGFPFVIILQAATENLWPDDNRVELIAEVFQKARQIFFVSRRNQELVEMMLARRLPHATVISNPFNASFDTACPYPAEAATFNLACVARLDPSAKSQDILLKVLALEKWRTRNLKVSFFGEGLNSKSLRRLAQMLDVRNIEFCGHTNAITDIWKKHHLLVLPSRYEGLPLSLVEAMLHGRAAVVSDVAGNTEVVDDNETGFVAKAPTVELLDEAMERAWTRRSEWGQMGAEAALRVRKLVPEDPIGAFNDRLLGLLLP